jgi:hypothetical protein
MNFSVYRGSCRPPGTWRITPRRCSFCQHVAARRNHKRCAIPGQDAPLLGTSISSLFPTLPSTATVQELLRKRLSSNYCVQWWIYSWGKYNQFRDTFYFMVKKKGKRKRYSCYRPWRPIGLREVEAPTLLRQTAKRWRQGCQHYAPAALYPQVSFLRFLVLISVRG